MGARHPDRIPLEHWRHGSNTVGEMINEGWDVHAKCQTCGLVTHVSLQVIAKVSGQKTVLWGRKQRCKKVHCNGFVVFLGKHRKRTFYEELNAPWPGEAK